MKAHKVTALAICLALLTSVCAYADPNNQPEIKLLFEKEQWDEINNIFYNDQTGIVDSTSPVEVTVKDTAPLWEASPYMLSTGMAPMFAHDRFLDLSTGEPELSEKYREFAPTMAKYPIMRLGFGNQGNMLKMLGPIGQRSTGECILTKEEQELYLSVEEGRRYLSPDTMPSTGPLEAIEMAEAVNPDVEFMIILSYLYATPEDNANFVRYLLDDPKESVWGAMRAEHGHPKPVKVHSLEFGNELYTRKSYGEKADKEQVDWYAEKFKEYAEAIGKYHPEVGIAMTLMCMDGEAHLAWNEPCIEALGPYIMEKWDENHRFVSLHHYYSGYEMAYTANRIQVQIDSFNKILGEGHHFKGLFSEHSKWAGDWVAPSTLGSGLATVAFLNRMYQWDELTSYCANYYAWYSPNLWNQFRESPKDGSLVRSPVDYVYDIYIKNLGDRVFKADTLTLDDSEIADPNSTRQLYTVCPMGKGKREMKLIMANRTTNTEVDLTFNFESGNNYTLTGETIYTAPNLYSFAYSQDTLDINRVTENKKNEPDFKTYKMPAKSMVVLTLKSNKDIAEIGGAQSGADEEPAYRGEDKFSDIYKHWAENEINLAAETGMITGTGGGAFMPDSKISREEFAAVIYRMLSAQENTGVINFTDVSDGDWFSEAVGAVSANGFMRGYPDGRFGIGDSITLSDAVSSVYRILSSADSCSESFDGEAALARLNFGGSLTEWEKTCFAAAVEKGLLSKFYEERTVEINRPVSRAEAVVLLYRLKLLMGW